MRAEAIVFDFDGTLVDTETPEYEAARRVWADHGHDYPIDRWLPYVGTLQSVPWVDDLLALVDRPLDERELRSRMRAYSSELLDRAVPRPGVVDVLTTAVARGLALAVASNAASDWVEGHLDRLGLIECFEAIVTVDRVRRGKPHPEPYVTACALVGVAPDRAIAVEDSATGVAAARAAGLYTVAVPGPMSDGHDLTDAHETRPSLAGFDPLAIRLA